MDIFEELASEAAENAFIEEKIKEKKIGKMLTLLSFRSEFAFSSFSLQREKGNYHTLLLNGELIENSELFEETASAVAGILKRLAGKKAKKVLAVGLGNPAAVVDRLGSETMDRIDPIKRRNAEIVTLSPSVFGLTGIESAEVARGVAREIKPDLVVAVDTLATRKVERLCRAVQLTDGGISPGGGVGNQRKRINKETVGVPVLSIGVPLLCHARFCDGLPASLVVTPKEIDLIVPAFASVLARGIEQAFS